MERNAGVTIPARVTRTVVLTRLMCLVNIAITFEATVFPFLFWDRTMRYMPGSEGRFPAWVDVVANGGYIALIALALSLFAMWFFRVRQKLANWRSPEPARSPLKATLLLILPVVSLFQTSPVMRETVSALDEDGIGPPMQNLLRDWCACYVLVRGLELAFYLQFFLPSVERTTVLVYKGWLIVTACLAVVVFCFVHTMFLRRMQILVLEKGRRMEFMSFNETVDYTEGPLLQKVRQTMDDLNDLAPPAVNEKARDTLDLDADALAEKVRQTLDQDPERICERVQETLELKPDALKNKVQETLDLDPEALSEKMQETVRLETETREEDEVQNSIGGEK